ncbi:type II secretion system protein GspL [Thalassococcus sp. BH17M4-6]
MAGAAAGGGGALRDRLSGLLGAAEAARIALVPAERFSLHRVDLPLRGERQRRAALPFALEDDLAQPIDTLHFALCTGGGGGTLAAVLSHDAMTEVAEAHPGLRLLPELLLIAAPDPDVAGRARWAVWRQGARALVRVSDGTGFVARSDMLATLWTHAGRPEVLRLGAPLDGIPAQDLSDDPPAPDPKSLRTDLRQGAFAPSRGLGRPMKVLAAGIVVAALAHLGLAYADLRAQRTLAADLKTQAQALLAQKIPEATVFDDPALLLAGLSRTGGGAEPGVLQVFGQVSDAVLGAGAELNLRRLLWSDRSGTLTLQVEAPGLEDIQRIEQALRGAGLSVRSGAVTAGQGAAQAELIVQQGATR